MNQGREWVQVRAEDLRVHSGASTGHAAGQSTCLFWLPTFPYDLGLGPRKALHYD